MALRANPHDLAASPDGRRLWVTDSPGRRVVVIDTASLSIAGEVSLAGVPHHVAITAGRALVVDNTNGSVVMFDLATRELLGTVPVAAHPHGVTADP